jgi:hypothetical protein
LDFRVTVAVAAAGGVALACTASFLLAGRSQAAAVADLDRRTSLIAAHSVRGDLGLGGAGLAEAPPLFPAFSGPNAPAVLAVALEGLAQSPGRTAALLSIGAKPAEWFALGETRDGVTLEEVGRSSVTVDTAGGEQTLSLGAGGAPAEQAAADAPPPEVRTPSEPASAPGAPR